MRAAGAVDAVLRCYPSWWRDRYGQEVRSLSADLLAEGRSPAAVVLDLLGGAARAWARAEGMPRTARLWSARTRAAVSGAVVAAVLAVPAAVAGMGTGSLHADTGRVFPSTLDLLGGPAPRVAMLRHGLRVLVPAPPLTAGGTVAADASLAMPFLVLALLFALLFAWGSLLAAVRSVPRHRRGRALGWAWAPGLALLVDVALWTAGVVVQPHSWMSHGGGPPVPLGGDPGAAHAIGVVFPWVALAGWVLSTVAALATARRVELGPADLWPGRVAALVVAGLLVLVAAGYLAWDAGLVLQARGAGGGTHLTVAFGHQALGAVTTVGILLAAAVAAASARVAGGSWRVLARCEP